MTELAIDTLAAIYHLPPSAMAVRERLDRAMAAAFEEALPLALARRGIDLDDGELCLREIRIPVRVRLSAGEGALALDWSEAAADAIAAAVAAGRDGVAVRFASRRQALVEFAAAVAAGDLRRMWAFAQLGLCRAAAERSAMSAISAIDAADDLARALAGEPEAIVPVLAGVARRGLLGALVARLPAPYWPVLAARALAAAGGAAAIPALEMAAMETSGTAESADTGTPPRVERALARSAVAATLRTRTAIERAPELSRAFAALALVEADPGLLRGEHAAMAVTIAAGRLTAPAAEPTPARATPIPAEEAALRERPDSRRQQSSATPDESSPWLARLAGWTDWGGLLFLLNPLSELGIPDEIAASPLLSGRPSRWSLHQLALALAPLAEDDPAALAFTGLPPDAPPPAADEPPASPEESELFAGLAARLAAEVARRLDETELGGSALIDRVCRRRAEILADPGWLEVRLSLSDVSTELRRARLDLDPGYLPFLGAVVRFVYV
jgi:hypothetical protein